jgi:hypothetical protein
MNTIFGVQNQCNNPLDGNPRIDLNSTLRYTVFRCLLSVKHICNPHVPVQRIKLNRLKGIGIFILPNSIFVAALVKTYSAVVWIVQPVEYPKPHTKTIGQTLGHFTGSSGSNDYTLSTPDLIPARKGYNPCLFCVSPTNTVECSGCWGDECLVNRIWNKLQLRNLHYYC